MNERKGATFTVLWPIVIVMTLLAPSLLAQGDALRGTWSGSWRPEGCYESSTLRFSVGLDDDIFSGEMINPECVKFTSISFDEETLRLVAEAAGVSVQAQVEDGTRLNGTLTVRGVTGEIRLTKWTFRP